MTDLTSSIVLITGASRGIGLAMAKTFAERGATVGMVARTPETLHAACRELTEAGCRARAWTGDVTDLAFMTGVVAEIERDLGRVDVLINNAGLLGPIGPLADVDHDDWWRCVEVNLRGTAIGMQAVLPHMCGRGSGRVINIVSGGATMSATYFSAYIVAKTAVMRLTECAASEVAPYGVTVLAMEPGTVATDMSSFSVESSDGKRWIPWFKRIFTEGLNATPEEVAERAVVLARGRADALSGRYIPLRGSLEELIENAKRIADERLYSLRLGRLPASPPPPLLAELRAQGEAASPSVVQLRRVLRCDLARAWSLWRDSDLAGDWFLPPNASWLTSPRADGVPGGELSFHLVAGEHTYHIRATYRDVEQAALSARLELDWSWRSDASELGSCEHTSLTVWLSERDGKTEVLIRHEGLPTPLTRDAYVRGWIRCLDGMERVIGTRTVLPTKTAPRP